MEHDFLLAQSLINAGLLTELEPDRIRNIAPTGAVLITCGDRDRFTGHLSGCQRIIPVHILSLNGGALLLGDGIDERRKQIILEDCVEAMHLKNLCFVFNLSHHPCGKSTALGIDLRKNILANLEGKKALREKLSQAKLPSKTGVLPIISIDWRSAPGDLQSDTIRLYATGLRHRDGHRELFSPEAHIGIMKIFDIKKRPLGRFLFLSFFSTILFFRFIWNDDWSERQVL